MTEDQCTAFETRRNMQSITMDGGYTVVGPVIVLAKR